MPDSNSTSDGAFSRDSIEAAMAAFEQYRNADKHHDIFSQFGKPSKYWVRSTRRLRKDQPFPTKPLIGYLLNIGNDFGGGWSESKSAAARLHETGYIIVDQNNKPIPLPNQYTFLMRGADRARLVALNYYIAPAREAGAATVTIRASELARDISEQNAFPTICSALGGKKFKELAGYTALQSTTPNPSSTTTFTFTLDAEDQEQKAMADSDAPEQGQTAQMIAATTNLILYGPPGTGKTYQTAWEAVRLCLGDAVAVGLSGENNRDRLMAEYQRLSDEGRIEFVTFHQSMSYEEFVEGLRPYTGADGAGFTLKPHAGVFKGLADSALKVAREAMAAKEGHQIDISRPTFNMSLGDTAKTNDGRVFNECIKNGMILLDEDYGLGLDWSDEIYGNSDAIAEQVRKHEGDPNFSKDKGHVSFIDMFRNHMNIGDIIFLGQGRKKLRAIGKVQGDYRFVAGRPDGYCNARDVEWVWSCSDAGPEIDITEFYPNGFNGHTISKMKGENINWPALMEVTGINQGSGGAAHGPAIAHVLIIDEINRANISSRISRHVSRAGTKTTLSKTG